MIGRRKGGTDLESVQVSALARPMAAAATRRLERVAGDGCFTRMGEWGERVSER
jgi:hypothetical protein